MVTRALPLLLILLACAEEPMERPPRPDAARVRPRDAGFPKPMDAGEIQDASAVDAGADASMAEDAGQEDAAMMPDAMTDAGTMTGGGCGMAPGANDRRWPLTHDGISRSFLVHFPPSYDENVPMPLVIDIHGRLIDATREMQITGLRDVADREGFIVVHPEGTDETWNAGLCCGDAMSNDVDDVGFLDAMLDELEASLCIDDRRVYATGLSNGGMMAYRLACELSDRITAIAPVAGAHLVLSCSPSRAVPVLHFHGTNDMIVFYDGFGGFASAPDSVAGWVSRNNCNPTPTNVFNVDDVSCDEWSGCDDGATVRFCTIDGGGHTWPGGPPLPGLGSVTQTIDASDEIWTFFSGHQR